MVKLEPLPDRTLIVLRNEAKAARAGTMVVHGVDIDMAELLEDAADEIERLRSLLKRIDDVTTWETTPLGRKFQDEVEGALGIGRR